MTLHEATPDVLEKIKKSEVFVLSSNNEGFPNSLAEAMSMGIACISTNRRIGGPKDMIENNKNGLLIDVNNLRDLKVA
ncbi:glycosyltransferase, partial [Staphylococcus sp. SIMBA_130]